MKENKLEKIKNAGDEQASEKIEEPETKNNRVIDAIMEKGYIDIKDYLVYNTDYLSFRDIELRDEPEGEIDILIVIPPLDYYEYNKLDCKRKIIVKEVFKKLLDCEFLYKHDMHYLYGKAKTFRDAIDYAKQIFIAFFKVYWKHLKKADFDTAAEIANLIHIKRDSYKTDSYWYTYHFGDMILFHIYEEDLLDELKKIVNISS